MPRIWNDTIQDHRRAVQNAVLDAAASLVGAGGLSSVTMSKIAEDSGIGRATLYKYFPNVETILRAWHEREVLRHLEHLEGVRARIGPEGDRLGAVLAAYASIAFVSHDGEIAASLHRGGHVAEAHRRLHRLVRDLIAEGAAQSELRNDVSPDELASFCLSALGAAKVLTAKSAIQRLVRVTLDGLRRSP